MLGDLIKQVVGAKFVTNDELHHGVYFVFALKVISRIIAVISLLTLRRQLNSKHPKSGLHFDIFALIMLIFPLHLIMTGF